MTEAHGAEPAGRPGLAATGRRLPAWLFVPGAEERFMAKLLRQADQPPPPDVVVLDLEDGVAPARLDAARARVAAALEEPGNRYVAPLCVRTHAVAHPAFARDLEALGPGLLALVLPKVGGAEEVRAAADALARRGLGHAGLVVMIESAAGLEAIEDVLRASPAVAAVALGAEDMGADLGLPPAGLGAESDAARRAVLDAVRARLVVAAAAAGVRRRVDSPTLSLRDARQVEEDARRARAMGFDAKFAVHPAQLAPLRAGFLPSPPEVAWARQVLASTSGGASAAGESMVDEAVARQAREVLAAVEEAGTEG